MSAGKQQPQLTQEELKKLLKDTLPKLATTLLKENARCMSDEEIKMCKNIISCNNIVSPRHEYIETTAIAKKGLGTLQTLAQDTVNVFASLAVKATKSQYDANLEVFKQDTAYGRNPDTTIFSEQAIVLKDILDGLAPHKQQTLLSRDNNIGINVLLGENYEKSNEPLKALASYDRAQKEGDSYSKDKFDSLKKPIDTAKRRATRSASAASEKPAGSYTDLIHRSRSAPGDERAR